MESKLNKIKNYVKENKEELFVTTAVLTSYVIGICVGCKAKVKTNEIFIGEASNGDVIYKNIKIINRV